MLCRTSLQCWPWLQCFPPLCVVPALTNSRENSVFRSMIQNQKYRLGLSAAFCGLNLFTIPSLSGWTCSRSNCVCLTHTSYYICSSHLHTQLPTYHQQQTSSYNSHPTHLTCWCEMSLIGPIQKPAVKNLLLYCMKFCQANWWHDNDCFTWKQVILGVINDPTSLMLARLHQNWLFWHFSIRHTLTAGHWHSTVSLLLQSVQKKFLLNRLKIGGLHSPPTIFMQTNIYLWQFVV